MVPKGLALLTFAVMTHVARVSSSADSSVGVTINPNGTGHRSVEVTTLHEGPRGPRDYQQQTMMTGMEAVEGEEERRLTAQSFAASFAVDTAGCRTPVIEPWEPRVRHLIEPSPTIRCGQLRLVTSGDTRLYLWKERLFLYDDSSDVSCCYRRIWRPDGDPKNYSRGVDDVVETDEQCVPFESGADMGASEFVKVECRSGSNGSLLFRDYHAFASLKARVEQRVRNLTAQDGASLSERPSVLILGIDDVSGANFLRQMNGTAAELRRLGAVEMLGYSKVNHSSSPSASGLFPSLVGALAGMSEEELRRACWPRDEGALDGCPWLWKDFRRAGYRTALGADVPWAGFNYQKVGFAQQPTDYYLRPYVKLSYDDVGHEKRQLTKLCTGSRLGVEVLLEYVRRLSRALIGRRLWALFWSTSLTHDFLNYPGVGDRHYMNLLRDLDESGTLNHTILVVMSDEGMWKGAFQGTFQGRLEQRRPLLWLLLPGRFQQRFPAAVANLRRNARRLSTPFDLHRTLLDVAHAPHGLDADSLRMRSRAAANSSAMPRGVSLFTELPATRTCASAGIEPHWYGNQSACMDNHRLKPYCYCRTS